MTFEFTTIREINPKLSDKEIFEVLIEYDKFFKMYQTDSFILPDIIISYPAPWFDRIVERLMNKKNDIT